MKEVSARRREELEGAATEGGAQKTGTLYQGNEGTSPPGLAKEKAPGGPAGNTSCTEKYKEQKKTTL